MQSVIDPKSKENVILSVNLVGIQRKKNKKQKTVLIWGGGEREGKMKACLGISNGTPIFQVIN